MRAASLAPVALALSFALMTAGCLGSGPASAGHGAAPPAPAEPGLGLPLEFATAWDGDFVLLATLAADGPTSCTLDVGYQSAGSVTGWEAAFLELRDAEAAPGWMIVSNSVQEVRVHAAGNAVGGVSELQGGWLDSAWTLDDVAAPVSILVGIRGLDPADRNLAVGLDCAGPARLESLEAGHDLAIWDAAANGGGFGTQASAVLAEAGANTLDQVAIDTTKPHGLAFVQEGYGQAGRVALEYPGGSHEVLLRPHFDDEPAWFLAHTGPGRLSASYSEVNVVAGGHWGLLAGLGPVTQLSDLAALSGHGHDCEAACGLGD